MFDYDNEPKKSMGQHWLNDISVLESMCDNAKVDTGDRVFEIGPGTGTLTEQLLKRGAIVTALEFDHELIDGLKTRFKATDSSQLSIIEGDVRTYDFRELSKERYKIVANIPYYLTANLMRRLTDDIENKPDYAVLLVQKEVAERVASPPGDMSIIAVAAQLNYEINLGRVVDAKLFTPSPKVDSQILIMKLRSKKLFIGLDEDMFFRIVKAGFSQRRKTLLNTISSGLRISRDETLSALNESGIEPRTRAQSLSLEDWYRLYQSIALKLSK